MASVQSGGVCDFSVEDLAEYLLLRKVRTGLVNNFKTNLVNGAAFLQLTEEDLKELVPLVGERVLIRQLLKQSKLSSDGGTCVPRTSSLPGTSLQARTPVPPTIHPCVPIQTKASTSASVVTNNWHLNFEIPDKHTFCGAVQDAIDSGSVCARARRGVVQVLRTLMTQHTKYPSLEEYNAVCRKLIEKYPKLHDGRQEGFDSWKASLDYSFRNFRRDRPSGDVKKSSSKRSVTAQEDKTSKRRRIYDPCVDITEETYEGIKEELKEEYKKDKLCRNPAVVKQLMERSRARRMKWITESDPLVEEILEHFPFLDTSKVLRQEFKSIAGYDDSSKSLLCNWSEWVEKIVGLGKVESSTRPSMYSFIREYNAIKAEEVHSFSDHSDFFALNVLIKLLYPRGAMGFVFIKKFEAQDVDMNCAAKKVNQSAPYIVFTGNPGSDNSQFFVSFEKVVICECQSLRDAFVDLIATYYVFNVTYPKVLSGILLFFQHIIFEIRDEQTYPMNLLNLLSSLQKVGNVCL